MSDQSSVLAHAEPVEPPVSFSHLLRTLRAYLPVIALGLLAVSVGYVIVAAVYYLLAPAQKVTSLPFAVQFKGAERGEYPNGAKFSSSEIIAAPVLSRTFKENDLGRFTTISTFSSSVFVLESNASRDALAREYQARLSDPRLTSVDRERIQREYELKVSSLSKNEFAVNYLRKRSDDEIPEVVAKKVLHDILRNWVDFVSNEQHVLEYRVAVLSPEIVAAKMADAANPIIDTIILRGKILRLLHNIEEIRRLPNAELARSNADGLSLSDIAVRLDDVVRYRLDPLVAATAAAGLDNRSETIGFLIAQLSHDERQLEAQIRIAETAERTLALYVNAQRSRQPDGPSGTQISPRQGSGSEGDTVMPQINEGFIDRLIQLTTASADIDFRRQLTEEYQRSSLAIVPLRHAVAYDRSILEIVRSGGNGARGLTPETIAKEMDSTRGEVRQLAATVHEIHRAISRNLNPSTELLRTGAPYTRLDRTVSVKKLALWGVLTCAVALLMGVVFSLLHSRLREEDAAERVAAAS